ncbi:hypothetical protein AVEN_163940-1 [Araneus ventricosus]|uniref:Uncharacterized protein n=1 Tax=Araneus ventricosus TaxID=182803 RepID=A0A4Y2VRG9_ARAVE|nr:hypothetical protein AVEN_163940-1 [Araneus ventricosus]
MGATKVSMTKVEPFGKVAESFASQQETKFSVRCLVRFPKLLLQACVRPSSSLFQTFRKVVKSPPSADKIEPPSDPYSYRGVQTPLQSRTEGNNPFFIPLLLTSS